MTAIDVLLERLIDYAGLFPPAKLSMSDALENYLTYLHSKRNSALGRLIVDADRVEELCRVAGARISEIRLGLIAHAKSEWGPILCLIDSGALVETLEIKADTLQEIDSIVGRVPPSLTTYFEIDPQQSSLLDAVCAAGARVKLRMGGVIPCACPSPEAAASMIQSLAERHLNFKATAGLHHPLRSCHPLNGASGSTVGVMHGFVNLFFASALLYLGGNEELATSILYETDTKAWRVSTEAIAWRSFTLDIDQIREVRRDFFISVGSCSFTDPFEDLEALGWQ